MKRFTFVQLWLGLTLAVWMTPALAASGVHTTSNLLGAMAVICLVYTLLCGAFQGLALAVVMALAGYLETRWWFSDRTAPYYFVASSYVVAGVIFAGGSLGSLLAYAAMDMVWRWRPKKHLRHQ